MVGTQELILILVVLLFVIGPTKLPHMARELGRVFQEFRKASSAVVETASSAFQEEDAGETLLKIAKNLGIETENKTVTQLIDEIKEKD
ncbi:MAG: twin-arginine translocase TatA/TatE family subunit [Candidatus Bathyarchaeota archaeon]|nr:twin-arginine translocase TatA/TatE family subunit [Candidatus Bathyarchaeota archaeon]